MFLCSAIGDCQGSCYERVNHRYTLIFELKKILTSKNEWLSFKTKLEALVEEYSDSIELEWFSSKLRIY